MSYFNDLNSFYRVFSPTDVYGKVSIRNTNGTTQSSADFSKFIYNNYIGRAVSGEQIINDLTPKNSSASSNYGHGYLYNTLFQKKGDTVAQVLHEDYWKHQTYESSDNNFAPIKPLVRGKNFYSEVCGITPKGPPATPPVNFTINVLRTPQINPAARDVSEIEFFLNSIPSVFASQMVPYFEVEFQLPRTSNVAIDSKGNKTALLNRTSLLRFLLGSEVSLDKLSTSEADRALVATIQDPKTKKLSYFTGMEVFTSPQTLTNMNSLGVQNADGAVRLNSVAPFLPPATLTQGTIKMMNAGAGTFSRCMADIDFKLHDRARLPEFAEFLRGPSGYGGTDPITVWITYGWLAPRGRGDDDVYAKFINENMLVKRAFQFKNAGYSFDPMGQCSVKLELVSKGDMKAESQSVDDIADETASGLIKAFKYAASAAEQLNNLIGNPGNGFGTEIRVFQVIDSTANGQTGLDIPTEEQGKIAIQFDKLQEYINSNTNLDSEKKKKAVDLIKSIRSVYSAGAISLIKKTLKQYATDRLDKCTDANSPDPFIPLDENTKFFTDSAGKKSFFTPDFVKATYDRAGGGKSTKTGSNGKNVERNHEPVVLWRNGKNVWVWHDTDEPVSEEELKERGFDGPKGLEKGRRESERRGFIPTGKKDGATGATGATGGTGAAGNPPAGAGPTGPSSAPPTTPPAASPGAKHKLRRKGRMKIRIRRSKDGRIRKYGAAATKKSKVKGPTQAKHKRSVVSFGKLFCNYCLPAILTGAAEEDIDEVQVNFYQLNEGCGPASLHNIAEFPIDLDQFIEQYSEYFIRRGGDKVNLFEFMEFVSMYCFGDKRSPGYGMKTFYAAYDKKNEQPAPAGGNDNALQSNLSKWFARYGDFKQPSLTVSTEVVYQNDAVNSKSDLLYQLASVVGPTYKGPREGKKIIKRIHIYDATLDQYANLRKEVLRGEKEYAVLSKELAERFGAPNAKIEKDGISYGDIKVIGSGRDVLRDFLGYTVPTIVYGANGTMIKTANLASKMDGLMATAALLGGSQRASAITTPNGLAMAENALPLRLLPMQLTMNTYGCPIAQLYQQYFLDFGTGTTLDNVYSCTQINHSFTPGKFETSWTFVYSDGYGRFYNAAALNPSIKNLLENTQPPPNTSKGGNSTTVPPK